MSKKNNILVVEDDADTRTAICVMLKSMGYNPIDFPSGQAALDGLKTTKVDLALLDIMMPVMNGYELLKKIKELPGYENLPVLMVTAKEQDSEVLEGYQAGADYYITKPFTTKQLEYGIKLFLS